MSLICLLHRKVKCLYQLTISSFTTGQSDMNRKRNNSINENSNHKPKGSSVDNDISANNCYSNELLIHREHPSSTQVACCSSFQFCVLYIFTLWIPCCDVRYDFHIKTMFGSSLPLVVCRRSHILFTLFVFACL